MQTPGDASGQLANMRQIGFEWQRMKLEAQYSLEWVAYYLIKYLSGPLKGVKDSLKDFNDKISQTMPQWTEKVARWLTMIINLGKSGVRFMSDMVDGVMKLFDQLPKGAKILVASLLGIGSLLIMSPVKLFIVALGSLLILLEDFYGYIDGRKSSKTLAPIWGKMIEWFDILAQWKESPDVKSFINDLDSIGKMFKELIVMLIDKGAIKEIGLFLWDSSRAIKSLAKGLWSVFLNINKIFGIKSHGFVSTVVEAVRELAFMGRAVAAILEMVGLVMQRDFAGATIRGKEFMKDYQQHVEHVKRFNKGEEDGNGSTRSWDSGDGSFESFVNAISGNESGGDYDALNKRTGAAGKFQIMPENWPSWSEQAGLPEGSEMTPDNQELVARYMLKQLYDAHGARDAAIAWYGGESAIDYSESAKNRKQGPAHDEPSINEYADNITSRMGSYTDAADVYAGYRDNAVSSYAPTPSSSNSNNSSTFTTGDINVNVTNDETQIAKTVEINIKDSNGKTIARQAREFGLYA